MTAHPGNTLPPVAGFDANITLDGGISAETKILALWSTATSQEAAAEADFALRAQQMINSLYTQENTFAQSELAAMNNCVGDKDGSKLQMIEAELQSYQSTTSTLTQIGSSMRDDANNKQQALSENDLISTAMDPNNKVASLVTSLGPAI